MLIQTTGGVMGDHIALLDVPQAVADNITAIQLHDAICQAFDKCKDSDDPIGDAEQELSKIGIERVFIDSEIILKDY